MRLALVYHQMISRGGLEGYLLSLAREFLRRGHDLRLITSRTDGVAESLGAEIVRIPLSGVPKLWELSVFARKAAKVARRPGEIVLGFGRTWSQDAHRAGGGCHALYSELLPWWRRWGLKNRLELGLERRLYCGGETRQFVVNATPIARQLERVYGVDPAKISVIHTAVDTEKFSPTPVDGAEAAPSPGPATAPPILLFVSSNHRRKGLPTLLRALVQVPDVELQVAGAPLAASDRRLAASLKLAHRVRELGVVSDLVPVYRQASWFVHPTLYDACANTVLQSMACALPGLISTADGASEFIRDGENGFLLPFPGQPAVLADTLRRALSLTPESRTRMAAAARRTVIPLTWQAHLDAWESLCARLPRA